MPIYSYDDDGIKTRIKPNKPSIIERAIKRWSEKGPEDFFLYFDKLVKDFVEEDLLAALPKEMVDALKNRQPVKPNKKHRLPKCDGKCCYPTEKFAADVRSRRRKSSGLRAYQCPRCNLWHLTRLPLTTYKRIKLINHVTRIMIKNQPVA